MQQNFPFSPAGAQGTTPTAQVSQSITTAVQQVTLPTLASDDNTMRIVVDGATNVAWSYGASSGLTLANGVFQLGNTAVTYTLPPGVTQLSMIGSAAAGTFRVVVGTGGS